MSKDKDLKRNASGCYDPTAHKAIENINKEDKRFHKLLHTIFDVCDLAGFEVSERIVLIDKRTGRIWR